MSVMQRHRSFAKMAATMGGFFWLPCPSCGKEFGGHEWTDVGGHTSAVPREVHHNPEGMITSITSRGICPDCTAKGVGCRAHAEVGVFHDGCEFAPQARSIPDGREVTE